MSKILALIALLCMVGHFAGASAPLVPWLPLAVLLLAIAVLL